MAIAKLPGQGEPRADARSSRPIDGLIHAQIADEAPDKRALKRKTEVVAILLALPADLKRCAHGCINVRQNSPRIAYAEVERGVIARLLRAERGEIGSDVSGLRQQTASRALRA